MQPEASMTSEAISAYTALAMAGGALVLTVWKASWGARSELFERDKRNAELAADLNEKIEHTERMIGETMLALRQKIVDTENSLSKEHQSAALWNRDNFVRRIEFADAIAAMRSEVQSLTTRLDHKLDDIGRKLDESIRLR